MENENQQKSGRPRQHRSREEKQKHLQDQASSGLSAAAYCRQHNLRYGNFLNWQHQVGEPTPSLRPMELITGPARSEPVAEIRFPAGQILLIQAECSERLAIALTKTLA